MIVYSESRSSMVILPEYTPSKLLVKPGKVLIVLMQFI